MTDEQVRETLMAFQTELRTRTLDKNKKDGEAFLAENKKKGRHHPNRQRPAIQD